MKGIILAGGTGSRLFPSTKVVSKQLIPIYNKPMVYYPLSTLLHSGIKEILIISTPHDLNNYKKLFGDGSNLGISIQYECQENPEGLAQAFILGLEFIGGDDVCLVLGDNLFHGVGLRDILKSAVNEVKVNRNAVVFGYQVDNPSEYGVVEFDGQKVMSIEEKPIKPKSNYAVVGLYFYPNSVIDVAKKIKPSERGELEITSVNQHYLDHNQLEVRLMGRGFTWLDTGSHDSLLDACNFVHALESRQGLMISCIEEIVHQMGYINDEQLRNLALPLSNSKYGQYLLNKIKYES